MVYQNEVTQDMILMYGIAQYLRMWGTEIGADKIKAVAGFVEAMGRGEIFYPPMHGTNRVVMVEILGVLYREFREEERTGELEGGEGWAAKHNADPGVCARAILRWADHLHLSHEEVVEEAGSLELRGEALKSMKQRMAEGWEVFPEGWEE